MRIRKVSFNCNGLTTLLFSGWISDTKRPDETDAQFEKRSWIQRATADPETGHLRRCGMEFQRTLCFAASWLSMKIPGAGNKTYTKRFMSGVRAPEPFYQIYVKGKPATVKTVKPMELRVDPKGEKNGKKRVLRIFPYLDKGWTIPVELTIIDEAITDEVFAQHIETAGLYDGIGAMRVGNGGPNGYYTISDLKFSEMKL